MSRPIVRRNTTFARVSFFTFHHGRIDAYDEEAGEGNVASSLLSFNFTKTLGEASGRATIVMKGYKVAGNHEFVGKPWVELIEEGDWWCIDIIKNGVHQGLSFGRIDSVGLEINANIGEGQVVVTVQGKDIGFALEETPIYFNPYDRAVDNALGIQMMKVIDKVKGRADEVVVNAIKGLMGGLSQKRAEGAPETNSAAILGGPLSVPEGLSGGGLNAGRYWVDFVDFTACVQRNLRGRVFTPAMFTPEGSPSVWQFIEGWRNPAMNEMFLDSVPLPGTPKLACLTLREKPFVNAADGEESSWFKLRNWDVESSMLKTISLTRGLHRVNHVSLMGDMLNGLSEDSLGVYPPVADIESIDRYGLHRLEERTRYFDEVGNIAAQVETKDWLFLIVSWNALNHEYYQGSLGLAEMRAEIRVGQKVSLINGPAAQYKGLPTDNGIAKQALTFYVEGIRHSYTTGQAPTATTTITVSRGMVEGERLERIIETNAKYEGLNEIGSGSRNDNTALDTLTDIEADSIDANKATLDFFVNWKGVS